MKPEDYKRLVDPIEPDEQMAERIRQSVIRRAETEKINQSKSFFQQRKWLFPAMAGALSIFAFVTIVSMNVYETASDESSEDFDSIQSHGGPVDAHDIDIDSRPTSVDDFDFPQKLSLAGGDYSRSRNTFDFSDYEDPPILEKKLTKLNNMKTGTEVYSVKGLDSNLFVIAAEREMNAFSLYENLNRLQSLTVGELLHELNATNQIASAQIYSFYSPVDIPVDRMINSFLEQISTIKPIAFDEDTMEKWYDEDSQVMDLELTLENGLIIHFSLNSNGYLSYGNEEQFIIYPLDEQALQKILGVM
jgi:hypothetical protein